MNILAACEESQAVCKAFRKKGHNAFSCDILECSGGKPEYHIKEDVLNVIETGRFYTMDGTFYALEWDIIIAFPPCTYLSNAGARHLYKGGVLNQERYQLGMKAKEFFLKIWNADCDKIAIENPVSSKIYELPPYTQEIQPYQFGHPVKKRTRLWLKGLKPLEPTKIVSPVCGCHDAGTWFMKGGKKDSATALKLFLELRRLWRTNGDKVLTNSK